MQKEEQKKEDDKRYQSVCWILLAVLCYCLSSFFQGYSMVYFNSIDYSQIEKIYGIQLQRGEGEGLLSGCITFGAIFGCLLSAGVINFFSRKHCFYFNNFLRVCSLILVLVPSFPTLLIGRILQGACVGIDGSVVPIMIKEYTPISLNGPMGAVHNSVVGLGYVLGFLLAFLLSQFFKPQFYYVFVFGFPLLTILLQQILLMTIFTSETPKYLLVKGRNEEAKEVIASIYKEEYRETAYHEKLRDLNADNPSLEGGEKQYPDSSCIAIFLAFVFHLFPHLVGISIISLYGRELVQKTLPSLAPSFGFLINLIKTISGTMALFILNKTGRKNLILGGLFAISFALLLLFFGSQYYSNNTELFSVFFDSGVFLACVLFFHEFGPINWIYPTEIASHH